jgi:hypothetical protein
MTKFRLTKEYLRHNITFVETYAPRQIPCRFFYFNMWELIAELLDVFPDELVAFLFVKSYQRIKNSFREHRHSAFLRLLRDEQPL